MSSRLVIKKDFYKRKLIHEKQNSRFLNSILKNDEYLPKGLFNKGNYRTTRIKNRCVVSGRARGVLNRFGLSRMIFKKFSSQGIINGVKKGSW